MVLCYFSTEKWTYSQEDPAGSSTAILNIYIHRGDFMAEIDINQIVWLDETGCDRRDYLRKFGYALSSFINALKQLHMHEFNCFNAETIKCQTT